MSVWQIRGAFALGFRNSLRAIPCPCEKTMNFEKFITWKNQKVYVPPRDTAYSRQAKNRSPIFQKNKVITWHVFFLMFWHVLEPHDIIGPITWKLEKLYVPTGNMATFANIKSRVNTKLVTLKSLSPPCFPASRGHAHTSWMQKGLVPPRLSERYVYNTL